MKCSTEDCFNPVENKDSGLCASCGRLLRKSLTFKEPKQFKPMPKVSAKMKASMALYSIKKRQFLKGKMCAVFKDKVAVDVHHRKGRIGDLLLDERYWIAVSREGHRQIEENPLWAKKNGFSDYRLNKTL